MCLTCSRWVSCGFVHYWFSPMQADSKYSKDCNSQTTEPGLAGAARVGFGLTAICTACFRSSCHRRAIDASRLCCSGFCFPESGLSCAHSGQALLGRHFCDEFLCFTFCQQSRARMQISVSCRLKHSQALNICLRDGAQSCPKMFGAS